MVPTQRLLGHFGQLLQPLLPEVAQNYLAGCFGAGLIFLLSPSQGSPGVVEGLLKKTEGSVLHLKS